VPTTPFILVIARRSRPHRVGRPRTWTAETNDAMQAINVRFGFRPVETSHSMETSLNWPLYATGPSPRSGSAFEHCRGRCGRGGEPGPGPGGAKCEPGVVEIIFLRRCVEDQSSYALRVVEGK
jgi:hypothetical protein